MDFFDQLQHQTSSEREYLLAAPIIHSALAGTATLEQYIAFLTQAYHHVKHTVPLLMACGARLPERVEWLRGAMYSAIASRSHSRRSGRRAPPAISSSTVCLTWW